MWCVVCGVWGVRGARVPGVGGPGRMGEFSPELAVEDVWRCGVRELGRSGVWEVRRWGEEA